MEVAMEFLRDDVFFDDTNKQMISSSMEMDDDAFYADLDRQISLLVTEDDDLDSPLAYSPSASFQNYPQSIQYPNLQSPIYYQIQPKGTTARESKGTGVFIPRSSQPRRKSKHGKHGAPHSSKPSKHHQIVSSRSGVPHPFMSSTLNNYS